MTTHPLFQHGLSHAPTTGGSLKIQISLGVPHQPGSALVHIQNIFSVFLVEVTLTRFDFHYRWQCRRDD
jgi:hypothetical protein